MRPQRTWTLVVGLSCLLSVSAGRGRVGRLIDDLSASDPAVRDAATELLSDLGPTVRPAVVAALRTASPVAAGRLSTVLLRTASWDVPLDANAEVRASMAAYATVTADERAARLNRVAEAGGTPGVAAVLIRALTSDPSPSVRWTAADLVRRLFDRVPAVGVQVLELASAPADPSVYPPAAENGPLLAAAGWAALGTDPARADALVGRAIALEVSHPSAFHDEAKFAFLWAADRAVDRGDFVAALGLLRELAARTPWSADAVPDAVADLFALHAERGPFAGFGDDLRLYRPYLGRPELIYCMAKLAGRQEGLLATGTAVGLDAAALAAGGLSPGDHCGVCLFLFHHSWTSAAERELQLALWLAGPDPSAEVYFTLYNLASERDDDAAAGRYLEGGLRRSGGGGGLEHTSRYGDHTPWSEAEAWGEVHWHYLRAAVTAGDRPAALAEARQLLDLDAEANGEVLKRDPGKAADIVPVLADAGRTTAADRCFDATYATLHEMIDKDPADPMPKNNLAWLCARSDRRLDEADRLSAQAVAMDPTDAACLDTRAEVLCRLGRAGESVALEDRALSVKPDDVYMQRQVTRFRAAAAAATKPTTRAAG